MDPQDYSAQEEEPTATRILVADDHALFRHGLKAMFASVPEYEVVGEAATGEEALEKVEKAQPDIVLMDIQMPNMNGIEATRKIVENYPRTAVVMLTMFGDDDSVFAAMRAGARGYVLKGADEQEVLKVVEAVKRGEREIGEQLEAHIRLEEQVVFPLIENSLPEAALTELAARLEVKEAGPRVEPWVPAEELSYAPWPGPGDSEGGGYD